VVSLVEATKMGYRRGVSLFRTPIIHSITLVFVVAPLGCGARTELDNTPIPRSGPSQTPRPAATPKPTATPMPTPAKPGGGGTSGNQNDPIGTSNTLGECKLGAAPERGQDCPYFAQNRCYSDPNSACACICPRNAGDTTCTEGFFPNASGAIEVNCFAL
jgi:hypothetical protein